MKVKLKVDEAKKVDVGKRIARIPVKIADKLNLRFHATLSTSNKSVPIFRTKVLSSINCLSASLMG